MSTTARRVAIGVGALVAAGAVVGGVLVATASEGIPEGTTVSGVAVGGLSEAEAEDALEAALADRADRDLEVTFGGRSDTVPPGELGLAIDYAASAAAARDGGHVDAVVEVDDDAVADYVGALPTTEPVDGAVRLKPKGVKVTDPVPGTAADPSVAREAFVAAYLDADEPSVELPAAEVSPDIDSEDVERVVREFAEPALSGAVTLRFGDAEVVLKPRQYIGALRLVAEGGELVPTLRPKALAQQLSGLVSGDGAVPVDAEIKLLAGKPRVIPAKPGVTFDQADVDAAFLDLVTRPEGERSMDVASEVVEPAFTTANAKALGIKKEISSFTTYYPYAEYRNINIGRAAELVDGTIVKPGETFSLNGTVGERTAENGFTKGFIISNGIFAEDFGGGVSQMATTTFNAAFFGGMTDVQHKPHSFYIDRYPVGREATVAWPTVDLQWRNDTPYGVLVHAHVTPSTPSSQGVVTVRLFSTKYWDITTKTGKRYAFTSPATRTLDTEDCYPNTGYGGFDINIWRYWRRAGSSELERTEKIHTTYIPSDTVICKPPGSLPD